jgi:hypothetical protein
MDHQYGALKRLKSPLRPQNWPVAAACSETLVFVWFNGFF